MKLLFDLFPVVLLFATYKLGEQFPQQAQHIASDWMYWTVSGDVITPEQARMMLAIVVAIIATIAQVAYQFYEKRKVDTMLWISLLLIVVFGGASIYLQDEWFIKVKPTVLYWLMAVALLVTPLIWKKNPIQALLGKEMALPESVWAKLNLAWVVFFAAMGLFNLYYAFNFAFDAWFKYHGMVFFIMTIVFVIAQSLYLSRFLKESE
jgi:intracellular septation protein